MRLDKKISVILPVYNGREFLQDSVQSVLSQSFNSFDFFILDDNSTDGSYEMLSQLEDDRIILIKNETNKGLFYNLNLLISKVKTPLIKLWAQDDIMKEDCLTEFINFYQTHPDLGFIYCSADTIDESGNRKTNYFIDTTPSILTTAMHSQIAYYTGSIAGNIANVCLTKAGVDKVGLFDEKMIISADFDMWVRLAEFFPTGFINRKLIQTRDHKNQLSKKKEYLVYHGIEDFKVFKKLDNYLPTEERKNGRRIMNINKLFTYYIIILKFFAQGDFKNGFKLLKVLSDYTSIARLTMIFISRKIGLSKPSEFDVVGESKIY